MNLTDKDLSRLLYKGKEEAFNAIYEKYWKQLFVYAYKIFEDQIVCEDIVQEVFVKLWERAKSNKIEKLESYLFRAVKFQAMNAIRDLKPTTDLDQFLIICRIIWGLTCSWKKKRWPLI